MKSAVKAFKILEESGFTKENAENFLIAIENDETALATKGDLRDLKSELLREVSSVEKLIYKLIIGQFLAIMSGMAIILKVMHV